MTISCVVMEALPDGGVLEEESQMIGLIGSEELSMVEASMLQSDDAMMGFVGEDDEALSVAFSNTFSNASTTTPSSVPRPSPSTASYPIVSSHSPTAPSSYSTSSSGFTTHSSPADRGCSSVVELMGHQHPLPPAPLLLTHQQHPSHHHHPPPQPQHLHSHPIQQHPHHHHLHPRNPPTQPQPPPPPQHPHGTSSYYHHEQVPLSPGRVQGGCQGGFALGTGFAPYMSASPLQANPNSVPDAQVIYVPQVKSEPSPVENSYIPNLKSEPQDDFIDRLEPPPTPSPSLSTYNPHPPNVIVGGRGGVPSVPYSHHGAPPTPSPGGMPSIEANGTPSPVPPYMFPTHAPSPYLLELAPLPSRQQHTPQHHLSQQQNQQQQQQLVPSAQTNGLGNFGDSLPETRPLSLGYYESSQLPQEDGRQDSTQETHMMYLPASQHSNLKSRVKMNRRKLSPSPLNGEDMNGQKQLLDQISNDSDDDTLIIDTSSVTGDGYECGECGMVCRTRGGLRKHLATEHLSDEPEPAESVPKHHMCTMPLCSFTTTKRDTYDLHIASHIADGWTPTGKKRHNKNPLQRHRYNKEELVCPLCEYSCTVEKAFRKHVKSHEGGLRNLSKYSCCVCGKDRPTESELKKHMKKHRIGKYYRCDICKFQTVQLKKLIQHRRMHTGEKPHLCPFCPYRAARRDNLRSHVRRMHKRENMYGDTFTPRSVLQAEACAQDTGKPIEQDEEEQHQQQQQPPQQQHQQQQQHHHQPHHHHPHPHHHHHIHNPSHQELPQPQVAGMSMVGPPPPPHQQPHASLQPPL